MPTIPNCGDVIVHKTPNESNALSHGLGIYEGPVQFSTSSQRSAFDLARRFARQHELDVWHAHGSDRYANLSRFRPTPNARPR